jgi:cytosine/creatinine deaminase
VPILDIAGDLVLPGLVDGHMHLDKTLIGLPWMPHAAGPARMSRIETDKRVLPYLPVSTEERAGSASRGSSVSRAGNRISPPVWATSH